MVRQMIKSISMLTLLVTLSLVTAVVSAQGQSSRTQIVSIPFEFFAGDKDMPAGKYLVRKGSGGGSVSMLGLGNRESVVKLTNNIVHLTPSDTAKLIFNRYGNTYFLTEVWDSGSATGQQLRKSRTEKNIARELALSHKRYEQVEVAYNK